MPEPLFTQQVHFYAPEGLLDRVRDAARDNGQTASEFMRGAIRDRLATDEVASIQEPASG